MTEEDQKLLKLYENRVKRLSQLVHDYEEYITRWDGINLFFDEREDPEDPSRTIPFFSIEFYSNVVKFGYNKQPYARRYNTERQFDFTLKNLDLAIDRYRKKVSYERDKRETGE